ncbi:MAG: fumarylacetoacetate hydrolase family protein [Muribaculaceae bacterium]|nr:fumarylacetoacetate hydrolase family protein [Muribaculaceae bacterium]
MKAVIFDINAPVSAEVPAVTLVADSALVMPGRPIFLPDFRSSWRACLYVVVRVSRLGKGVGAKFAYRYYDALGLGLHIVPDDTVEALSRDGYSAGLKGLFDGALALGPMIPAGELTYPITAACEGQSFEVDESVVNNAVSLVSSYATLKTGDLILPSGIMLSQPPDIGSIVEAQLCGRPVLRVKIK